MPKFIKFTDIHFGCHGNSIIHNEDCIKFIEWMIVIAKKHGITECIFEGDWHEHRNSTNSVTLTYSQKGLELLNKAFTKVYFIVGNHDNFNRNNADFNSLPHTSALNNIELIEKPTQHGEILFVPWLFNKSEYDEVIGKTDARIVCGHFEFNDFVVAGAHYKMEHGIDPRYYKDIELISTGHYHKRQRKGNVQYIGNTFPTSYSDANDSERGCCIMDTSKKGFDMLSFHNWEDAPVYTRCTLSQIIDDKDNILHKKASVECDIDVDITYLEAVEIRKQLMDDFELRAFTLKDKTQVARDEALEETETEVEMVADITDMHGMILEMLDDVKEESINSTKLKRMFQDI